MARGRHMETILFVSRQQNIFHMVNFVLFVLLFPLHYYFREVVQCLCYILCIINYEFSEHLLDISKVERQHLIIINYYINQSFIKF